MRLAFAGTAAFASVALQALIQAGHEIAVVLTQPDRPAGRGLGLKSSAVKVVAVEQALPIAQPESLKVESAHRELARTGARAMVVAAYGLILPQSVLNLFPLGCLNIHASLLPRWRGAAPIQRALLAGDSHTGISIMQMDAGLDTGPLLLRESILIRPNDTAQTLHDRLAELGACSILRALEGIDAGTLAPQPQPETGGTYAHKVGKEEAELDWRLSASELGRRVRAFNPIPVATTRLRDERVRVWQASPLAGTSKVPGVVVGVGDDGIDVSCGKGVLRLEELQRAGGRRMRAYEFVRGFAIEPGERLGHG